jgi:HEAT repeat protein
MLDSEGMKTGDPIEYRNRSLMWGLFILVGCGVCLALLRIGEPRYQGRTLTNWLKQYSRASLDETNQLATAQEAIRAIGPKKSVPIFLKLLTTKDSRIDKWVLATSERFKLDFLHWQTELDCELEGADGFEVQGSNAAPAVGALTRLLDDPDRAFTAARCLDDIGKPADNALRQCLTNSNPQVREWGVGALAGATDDVEVYISRIKECLKDPEALVRLATVRAIGGQDNAPDLAVPILIGALNDPDAHVSAQAAESLGAFGTNSLPAFSPLTNMIAQGEPTRGRAAMKALAAIVPTEAIPVLSNTVANGTAALSGAALRTLKSINPELSRQMTLAQLRSPDAQHRMQALSVTGTFETDTPGIAEALKQAAQDSDPEVARRANMTMREMVQKKKDSRHVVVQFPDDPSYQGKPIGVWLEMLRRSSELPTNCVQALKSMGTNVIPLLLRRVEYKDPVFGLDDFEVSMEGVSGLIALGDKAKPALPRLAELMDGDDEDLALRAMIGTLGTGRDAMPYLIKGLTNRFPVVRSEAANNLTSDWNTQFPEERKRAVPQLLTLLKDPDENVRMAATNGLKTIDPQAAAKVGIK